MRNGILTAACFFCVLAVAGAQERDGDSKKAQELKWARGVAEDFLQAVQADEWAQARLLMSKELLKLEGQTGVGENDRLSHRFRTDGFFEATSMLRKEEMAPDQDEAVFRGEITGIYRRIGGNSQYVADLTLRVEKDKETGKWRVSFMTWSNVRPLLVKKPEPKAKRAEFSVEPKVVILNAGNSTLVKVNGGKPKSCDPIKGFLNVKVDGENYIELVADAMVPKNETYELTIRGTEGETARLTVTVRGTKFDKDKK